MPYSSSYEKFGPIQVSESDEHFLVHIHPENRDRAKRIPGRQWDGVRKFWVFPKDIRTFEALCEEFQKDADSFNIRKPKTKRPKNIQAPSFEHETEEETYNDYPEELRNLGDIEISQGQIQKEIEQVRNLIESLKDYSVSTQRSLKEIQQSQQRTDEILTEVQSTTKTSKKTEQKKAKRIHLDLSRERDIDLMEKTLMLIAVNVSKDRSFAEWLDKQKPLSQPSDFIATTHELLKGQLEKLLEDSTSHETFGFLVIRIRKENLIFNESHDPVQVIPILNALNHHRNRFVHARGEFTDADRWSRSIIYLMNLAYIWPRIVTDIEEGNG